MTEWFEEWFGEEYLHLYPHRDEADAERLVSLICRALPWQPGWRVLDVACGAGRHLAALSARGANAVGVDLSLALLRRVQDVTDRPVARADMRALPVRPRTMDLTVNLFTSFGYFERDDEHAAALAGMLETVRPGGWFAIDFLNPARVRDGLVPEEQSRLGDRTVHITRKLVDGGRFVVKTILTPEGREFRERVRLLEASDLARMISGAGARVKHQFGDYAGGPIEGGSRTILLAQAGA
jgi:SAM-dependent methyltransferase